MSIAIRTLDQEAVALICAVLAYGNVKQIRRSVANLLERMEAEHALPESSFGRWICADLSAILAQGICPSVQSWRGPPSLARAPGSKLEGARFTRRTFSFTPGRGRARHLGGARRADRGLARLGWPASARFVSLSADGPRDGSCCKRWCMFLRWMGARMVWIRGSGPRVACWQARFPKGVICGLRS